MTAIDASTQRLRVLLLGIGNLLWADEGFGVRCIEVMAARYRFGANVTLLDGGTQGLYLIDQVRAADVLVVFDAVDYGLPPGTLKRVEGDEVPRFLGAKKMSLHQTGFQEVLALADLFGDAPDRQLLIGVQPVELEDFGGSLRPAVRAAVDPAIALALTYLAELGIEPIEDGCFVAEPSASSASSRLSSPGSATGLAPASAPPDRPHPALDLAAYEQGRPSPEAACRRGDARVLARMGPCSVECAQRRSGRGGETDQEMGFSYE